MAWLNSLHPALGMVLFTVGYVTFGCMTMGWARVRRWEFVLNKAGEVDRDSLHLVGWIWFVMIPTAMIIRFMGWMTSLGSWLAGARFPKARVVSKEETGEPRERQEVLTER